MNAVSVSDKRGQTVWVYLRSINHERGLGMFQVIVLSERVVNQCLPPTDRHSVVTGDQQQVRAATVVGIARPADPLDGCPIWRTTPAPVTQSASLTADSSIEGQSSETTAPSAVSQLAATR